MRGALAALLVLRALLGAGAQTPCLETLKGMIKGGEATEVLLLEMMLAASGKTPPFDAGKYEVCKNIATQTQGKLKTRFFIANLYKWGVLPTSGEVGLCLPAACTNADLEGAIFLLGSKVPPFKGMQLTTQYSGDSWPPPEGTVLFPNPFNEDEDRTSWGAGTTPALVVIGLLVFLVLFSTALSQRRSHAQGLPLAAAAGDAALLEGAPARPPRYPAGFGWCEAFTLTGKTGTWTTLFKAEAPRPTDFLDGLKVISMFFIVVGHTCMESMNVAGYKNAEAILKTPFSYDAYSTSGWTYLLLSGQLCVDTFLFISGFLLSFIGKRRPVPVVMGTFLRYARLMPLFGFVMMTYICVVPYLAWGPFSPRLQSDVRDSCQGSGWWSQFLFISDWYPWYNLNGGCMGWSWYLSIDMTFAIVGMMLLNLWKLSRPAGWALASLLAVVSVAITMQQAAHFDIDYDVVSGSFQKYAHYIYFRPYTRFPGFFLGLVTPWLLDERPSLTRGLTPRTLNARAAAVCASLVAAGVLAFCIWFPMTNTDGAGPSPPARNCSQDPCWSKFGNMIWISLSRPLWVLAWVVLSLSCYFGYLPALNGILAAPVFRPLSALTFGAYLTHPAIIKLLAANSTDYYTYSPIDALSRAALNFVLCYSASVVTWCLVEKPFATMTGWLVPKRRPREAGGSPSPTVAAADAKPAQETSGTPVQTEVAQGGRTPA